MMKNTTTTRIVFIICICARILFASEIIDNAYINSHKDRFGFVYICGDFSGDNTNPALWLKYDKNVTGNPIIVIQNSTFRGSGYLIDAFHSISIDDNNSRVSHNKVIIRNCKFFATNPCIKGKAKTEAIKITASNDLQISNNEFNNTGGTYIEGVESIIVVNNKFKNIDGRKSNGGCGENDYQPNGQEGRSAIAIGFTSNLKHGEIAWNEIVNEPDNSWVEDNINLFQSSGTYAKYIKIHDNYIQGAYPFPADGYRGYSGGGINSSDGIDGLNDGSTSNRYVEVYNNQVINTLNYGISLNSGHDIKIYDNRIVSSGKVWGKNSYSKVHEWDCNSSHWGKEYTYVSAIYVSPWFYMVAGGFTESSTSGPPKLTSTCLWNNINNTLKYNFYLKNFNNHLVSGNYIRWDAGKCNFNYQCNTCNSDGVFIFSSGLNCIDSQRHNYNCSTNGNNCANTVTHEDEIYEYWLWKNKLHNNGRIVGLVANGAGILTRQIPVGLHQNVNPFTAYEEVSAIAGTVLLPNSSMELLEFSFTACATNNNNYLNSTNYDAVGNSYRKQTLDSTNSKTNFSNQTNLLVYPNPSKDIFHIKLKDEKISSIKVYDTFGTIVINQDIENTFYEYDLTLINSPNGIYLIKVCSPTNQYFAKLILSR